MKTVRVILEGANNRVESRLSENDEESAAVVRIQQQKTGRRSFSCNNFSTYGQHNLTVPGAGGGVEKRRRSSLYHCPSSSLNNNQLLCVSVDVTATDCKTNLTPDAPPSSSTNNLRVPQEQAINNPRPALVNQYINLDAIETDPTAAPEEEQAEQVPPSDETEQQQHQQQQPAVNNKRTDDMITRKLILISTVHMILNLPRYKFA